MLVTVKFFETLCVQREASPESFKDIVHLASSSVLEMPSAILLFSFYFHLWRLCGVALRLSPELLCCTRLPSVLTSSWANSLMFYISFVGHLLRMWNFLN